MRKHVGLGSIWRPPKENKLNDGEFSESDKIGGNLLKVCLTNYVPGLIGVLALW